MSKVPTVRIKAEVGFIVINESDYNPKTMELLPVERERTTPPDNGAEEVTVEKVVAAIKELDEDNDELWTDDGSARTDALSDALGKPVTAALRNEAYLLIEKD